jgi:hypothetical protein
MADLLDKKLIEYTIPEKPRSQLKQYMLTEKGKNGWIPRNDALSGGTFGADG